MCRSLFDCHKTRGCYCHLMDGEQMLNLLQWPGRPEQWKDHCPKHQMPFCQENFQELCLEIWLLGSRSSPPLLSYVTGQVTNPHSSWKWAFYTWWKFTSSVFNLPKFCHHMCLAPQRRPTVAMSWFCQWHTGIDRVNPQTLHFVTSLGWAGSQIH